MGGPTLVRRSPKSYPRPLTARECATLERLARGMTQKMIAFEFGISINTVGNLAANAYKKLGVHGAAGRGARAPGRALLLRNPRRSRADPRAPQGGLVDLVPAQRWTTRGAMMDSAKREADAMADDLTVNREGDVLVIRIPIKKATPSASGKTLVVASTRGNQKTAVQIDGMDLYLGVNAYVYAAPKATK